MGSCWSKVRAAALNFPDVLMAAGQYQEQPALPYTPASSCAAVVEGRRTAGPRHAAAPPAPGRAGADGRGAALPVPEGMPDEKAAGLS